MSGKSQNQVSFLVEGFMKRIVLFLITNLAVAGRCYERCFQRSGYQQPEHGWVIGVCCHFWIWRFVYFTGDFEMDGEAFNRRCSDHRAP